MPYKDKEAQKKAVGEAVKRHRQGITNQGITGKGITEEHPVMKYLIPGEKREAMGNIIQSLNRRGLAGEVYLGVGGMPFDFIGELQEATQPKSRAVKG